MGRVSTKNGTKHNLAVHVRSRSLAGGGQDSGSLTPLEVANRRKSYDPYRCHVILLTEKSTCNRCYRKSRENDGIVNKNSPQMIVHSTTVCPPAFEGKVPLACFIKFVVMIFQGGMCHSITFEDKVCERLLPSFL
jgi:hypothetical protein